MRGLQAACLLVATGVLLNPADLRAKEAKISELVAEFLGATDDTAEADVTARILAEDPPFEDIYRLLKAGPVYATDVSTGTVFLSRQGAVGLEHHYFLLVPEEYDPSNSYPVRVYLHGGVERPAWKPDGAWWRRHDHLARRDEIAVFPSSWNRSLWWEASQVENLIGILDSLKRTYHIDPNRVYLLGISDGGGGVYFHAFKAPTPWAGFCVFIGHPGVLRNPRLRVDGEIFAMNLLNRPLFVVNGTRDRLYPPASLMPYLQRFKRFGVDLEFRAKESGHHVRWWPEESANIDQFIESRPRHPLPDQLAWQTERVDRYNRITWLVVEELGSVAGESPENAFPNDDLFVHAEPSGRVLLQRNDNTVALTTRGVREVTLLLSPDQFSFDRPFTVVVNGVEALNRSIPRSVNTLLKWHGRDKDRTMLFAAELRVTVPEQAQRGRYKARE